jgi:hypothetical protein
MTDVRVGTVKVVQMEYVQLMLRMITAMKEMV